jgi:hypothetical protein
MLTEQEKLREVAKLVTYIYSQYDLKLTPLLIKQWRDWLSGCDIKLCWKAARELALRKSFGAPKFSDFFAVLKEVAPKKYTQHYSSVLGGWTETTLIGIDAKTQCTNQLGLPALELKGIE